MEKVKRKKIGDECDSDYEVETLDTEGFESKKETPEVKNDGSENGMNNNEDGNTKPSRRKNRRVNYTEECFYEEDFENFVSGLTCVNYTKNENDRFHLKIKSTWNPKEAVMMPLMQAPTFFPTREEFKDPYRYISSIKTTAENYGICKIVPPSDWSPKCCLLQNGMRNKKKFLTRVQKIHKLQNRNANMNEPFGFESGPFHSIASFKKYANNFKKNYFQSQDDLRIKSDLKLKPPKSNGGPTVEEIEGEFWRIVLNGNEELEVLYGADIDSGDFGSGFDDPSSTSPISAPSSPILPNPNLRSSPYPNTPLSSPSPSTPLSSLSLSSVPLTSHSSSSPKPCPLFHSPKSPIQTPSSILDGYGSTSTPSPMHPMKSPLASSSSSPFFPSPSPSTLPPNSTSNYSHETYAKSGWNLKNLSQINGSVLAFEESKITGVIIPWLYIGMCFSSFCWHVEDHHLYSVNYNHGGSEKIWYGIPSSASSQFEQVMRKHLPHLFQEQPNLLHNLVTHFSPAILQKENVPVYRVVQRAKEFVVTFPAAYHSGFNCGFNCAEAVNFAPSDWLLHGQIAIDLYRVQKRRTSISHDKILIRAAIFSLESSLKLPNVQRLIELGKTNLANETIAEVLNPQGSLCLNLNVDRFLLKALETRVLNELSQRMKLIEYGLFFLIRMDDSFDFESEKECVECFYDLYLSAVSCPCQPNTFSCLLHFNTLCNCGRMKTMHYRYSLLELKTLLLSLKGNFDHMNEWLKMNKNFLDDMQSKRNAVEKSGSLFPPPTVSEAVDSVSKDDVVAKNSSYPRSSLFSKV